MEELAGTLHGLTPHVRTWNILDRLLELFGSEDVQDSMKETARLYFQGDGVTVNLIWSFLIAGALVLCE